MKFSVCTALLAATIGFAMAPAALAQAPNPDTSKARPGFCSPSRAPVSPDGRLALQLDKSSVSQGGYIRARVFDGTSRPFSTDLALRVRMLHDGEATRMLITENGIPIAWPSVEFIFSPHSISQCSGFSVSPEWQPGRYQVLMEVSVGYPAKAETRWLTAPFRVR